MVVSIIAMVAVIVLPMFTDNTRLRLQAAAAIVSSDIELAQVMTMAQPDEPIIVRFDNNAAQYWLAHLDSPNTPIAHPQTGEPYLVEFGTGRARTVGSVVLNARLSLGGNNDLRFAPHGGLHDFSFAPNINIGVPRGGQVQWIRIRIDSNTGSMSEDFFTSSG